MKIINGYSFFMLFLVIFLGISPINLRSQIYKSIDSFVKRIDKDTKLMAKEILIDTAYVTKEGMPMRSKARLTVYSDSKTSQVRKIVWSKFDSAFYDLVTLYYNKGKPVKGLVNAKYLQNDTNIECEVATVFYVSKNKIDCKNKLSENDCKVNCFWYLTTINELVELAYIKLR